MALVLPQTKRSNLLIFGAAALLSLYLILLIGLVFSGQKQLSEADRERLESDLHEQAATVGYFFAEQGDALRELTGDRAIQTYLANQALGMSMEYGLRSSLLQVVSQLRRLLERKQVDGQPVYRRIVFFDTAGRALADNRIVLPQTGSAVRFSPSGNNDPWLIPRGDEPCIGEDACLAAPVVYKGVVAGYLLARLDFQGTLARLLKKQNAREQSRLLLDGSDTVLFPLNAKPHRHNPNSEILATPVSGFPLVLEAHVNNERSADYFTSPWLPVAISLLSLPLLAGLAYLVRLNNQNLVLQTRHRLNEDKQSILRRQRDMQHILSKAAAHLLKAPVSDKDLAIDKVLQISGEELGADRAYLFLLSADRNHFSNTHEWCAQGVEAHIHRLQNIATESTPWWWKQISERGSAVISNVRALPPEAAAEKAIFDAKNIQSLMGFPLQQDGETFGFIGYDVVRGHHDWTESEQTLLRILADIVSGALARWRADAALHGSEAFLNSLIEAIPIPVFYKDDEGRYLGFNRAFEGFFGAPREKLVGKTVFDLNPPELAQIYHDKDQDLLDKGGVQRYESQVQGAGNVLREVIFNKSVFFDSRGETGGLIGVIQDITERIEAERRLELAASVFTFAREGIMITDAEGKIIEVNDAFTYITGYARNDVLGEDPRILNSGRHSSEFYSEIWNDLLNHGQWHGEIWNKRKNGDIYPELLTISAVHDENGNTLNYVALFSDITTQKEHQRQLEQIAHHDSLTNLPNRALLADRMHQAMAQIRRSNKRMALVYLDLDGFKNINDTFGHDIGDRFLISVAERMKAAVRDADTIARLGGDEFVAALLDVEDDKVATPLLQRLLDATGQTVEIAGFKLQVSASLGVTFYPQSEDVDADQLLRQADQSMYQAKLAGKNRFHVFDAEHDRDVRGRHESVEHIRHALERQEFVLHYQPKVNMRSGEIIGAEALVRWQHPERGLLPPAVFLPVIEDHPLSSALDEWVLDTALEQMECWNTHGRNVPISVNVGAHLLQREDFVQRLSELLADHPTVAAADLELEVLETSALDDMATVSQVMHDCADMGITFALDDFGTGYSSLTYLKRLPADKLKVDRSFVRDMLDDPEDLAIVDGVLSLATAFRRQAIAEGVETPKHGEILLLLGCELGQGYAIAKPMPAEDFENWCRSWLPEPTWPKQKTLSRSEIPLLFAAVEHRAWFHCVEEYINGRRGQPPQLNYQECRFYRWLSGDGRAHYGSHGLFEAISALHQRSHRLATETITAHDEGRTERVGELLVDLHEIRDNLFAQLRQMAE